MAQVVVVGGGFGGLASAARLAKLGHDVTLVERSARLGGAMTSVSQDGFTWDAGPTSTLLPAVIRDLFRKSGRPVEKEVELVALDLVREHRFEDRSVLRLPGGTRGAQLEAFEELGKGLGQVWVDYVESFNEDWEVLRRGYFEVPRDPASMPADAARQLAKRLDSRETLHKRLRRSFRDERLALVAGHPFVAEGHDLRNVPAWAGLRAYLEQRFDAWTVPGGMAGLTDALESRLSTRHVTVLKDTPVLDLVLREGRVVAVATAMGEIPADVVVVAVDPRRLPALASYVERTMPAIPPVITHLGLEGDLPEMPHEVVLHGDPLLILRTGGQAPEGGVAWTLQGRGRLAEDMLRALARHKIDVRDNVVTRVDLSPRDLVNAWGGSPMGVLWQGRSTVRHRLGPTTPIPRVYAAGAHATPGAGLPFVGLSASLVAQAVGPA
ncbi:phytoene desaturase [Nocardioides psychrotolerans]|uniref:UDP-galactopyranose mutase n=1 Tax=Nocardioides psychrotolerans TaxID=1005945 RepID=A0A1I3D9X7_9ACTN|nr:FAD-dependent oxidoreductase [Nocardioides psychrotolerans]GEP37102.1 phytoene desaturase [Nocardioides psychrotolerans]SFH83537.1 UDP-galactopyranose mutase [Nocardioides psychrotolerans]